MALKRDWGLQAEVAPAGNNDHALQALTRFESLAGDAIESFAAEIFSYALDGWSSGLSEQTYPPMQWKPHTFAAITRWGHGATLANPSGEGRDCSFLWSIEQFANSIIQGVYLKGFLQPGLMVAPALFVDQPTWGVVRHEEGVYLRVYKLEPSDKINRAVIAVNRFRHHEVDRPLVIVADAPSLTSATRFQDPESKGAQNERPSYERCWIVFYYEGNLHGSLP